MVTAVVLSGGGSLGSVQVGMLLALAEHDIVPDFVVGTSVGALNAAFVAGGPGLSRVEELARVWSGLRRQDVFPMPPARIMRVAAGKASGLADPAPLEALVRRSLPYRRLEDAHWPVAVVATDVLSGQEVVLREGSVVAAVMASAALPAVFPPVRRDGRLLMDGGIVNNTPLSVAHEMGADLIYVLPTGYACALPTAPQSVLGMAMHAVTVAIQQRMVNEITAMQASVMLRVAPTLCPLTVSPIDFRHTDQLIARARSSTLAWLERPIAADQASEVGLHSHSSADRKRAATRETDTSTSSSQVCDRPARSSRTGRSRGRRWTR